jgi:predicted nucleic acid-binding protein
MIVVSDASPLLALAQADSLHLLKVLFGRILIPCAG